MLDLLSSKGSLEILEYINKHPHTESRWINADLGAEGSEYLTTATIYRRIKELELAGFIMRDPPNSKSLIITEYGKKILTQQVKKWPEIAELRRTRRALLQEIKEQPHVNVAMLSDTTGLSNTTVQEGLRELNELGLIEKIEAIEEARVKKGLNNYVKKAAPQKPDRKDKKKSKKPGRPTKRLRLTSKGEEVYFQQQQLEEVSKIYLQLQKMDEESKKKK